MANVAGRPNISNEVLDENGRFTSIWYRFMEQMWVRSGGSVDDVSGLRDAIELIELIPTTENIPQDDLTPSVVEKEVQDDLAPRFEIDQDTLTAADIGNIVQAFSADLDIYAANPLTAEELGELQNINSVTITNAQWAFLGNFDQPLTTTSNVTFASGIFTDTVTITDTNNPLILKSTTTSIFKTWISSTSTTRGFDGYGSALLSGAAAGDRIYRAQSGDHIFTQGNSEIARINSVGNLSVAGTTAIITAGTGSPEGVVTAIVGSLFQRTDGGANTSLYVKESGTGNTGWIPK